MTMRASTAVFSLLTLVCAGTSPVSAAPSAQSLLASLRKAMLERPIASISSIHTVGTVEIVGISGKVQEWDDLRGVRFTSDQNAGALSGASGWDGKVAWNQDYAGLVTVDGGTSGRLQAIAQAYLNNLRYLRPDAGGATVVYGGQRTDGGRSYDVLAVTPPQGSELDLWIDPGTHLIARETGTIGIVSATTTLSNYRRVDGIMYPFASETQTSNGNSITEHVSTMEINTDVAERMRVPGENVHDYSIAGGTSTSVPLQIVNNHVYLNVMLDGRGPYTFVLDSGGDYIVTPDVANALRAKTSGGLRLQGVGNATEGASFTHIDSIAIGNAVVRDQYTLVLPIATGFGVAEGMRIDGMVGYQLLARFLITIDYANSKLTLAMPSRAPAAAPGAVGIGFFIDGSIPRIPVTVDGVSTSAEVDTGNRAGLELSAPFLATHAAIAALAKTAPSVIGFGVGGPAYARLGRIPALQVGPYQINNTVASFSTQSQGALADPFNPANIGGAIWRRFDVTFDYAHLQLLLAKNANFDAPFSYDRSGLFLIDANGAYTVLSVLPASPASAAGLAKGDVIIAVNGAPASSDSLAAIRGVLSGPVGSVARLRIRGPAGHERDVPLTLADYV
jgi:PDZ domain/Aspartyl protease